MNGIESPERKLPQLPPRYTEVLDAPPINDYNKRQIQLAVEKFWIDHASDTLDQPTLENILMKWADTEATPSYSKVWSGFVRSEEFAKHARFNGDFSKVELADLEYFIVNKRLPE